MNWELAIKLGYIVIVIIGCGKIIYEIVIGKRERLREEYEFAKDFLRDAKNENIHPFALDKGYQAIAGTSMLNPEDISYVLSLKNPARCLKNYVFSNEIIEGLKIEDDFKLSFKKRYKKPYIRGFFQIFYAFCYLFFAFIALSPVIALNHLDISALYSFVLLLFTFPVFGTFAWWSVMAVVKITKGEELISAQEKHTETIVVAT